ncbi:MAG: alpha/beta hydrolase [Acidimicrobiales bacterium]
MTAILSSVAPVEARTVTSEDLKKPLRWKVCNEDLSAEVGSVFECAKIRVPLDYDRPFGSTVEVQMVRIPASDPENREGAILLNPGGPGGSGIQFVLGFGPFAGDVFGQEVTQRFDLVGFDPRGINLSSPVRCFSNLDRAFEATPPVPFPLTAFEESLFAEADRELARACRRRPPARGVGSPTSTNNVAKDMDVIRASMGDEYTHFLGLSYGSYVGNVYANLFPDRVRSVVIDGVLDPIAWVNLEAEVPFSTRLRSDEGAAETLEEFFAQCEAAAPGNCALAPNSKQRYAAIADALRAGPAELIDPSSGETFLVTYQDLIGVTLGELYNAFGYSFLAFIIADLEAAIAAPAEVEASVSAAQVALARERYVNIVEGFPSVGCVDTTNPTSYDAWSQAGAAADAEFGYFGRLWTWASSPCAQWPFRDRDRYEGPFTAETANPVLVIGNLYDPATRYEGAQTARSLLPNSGLLTVDVPGHTSLGASFCAGAVVGQYFLDPAVAAEVDGLSCPSEYNAFDVVAPPPPPPGAEAASVAVAAADSGDMTGMIRARAAIMEQTRLLDRN